MKKDRIVEYDIVKGIAILGVMMVHIPAEYRLIKYGIAFHIVVFFTVAGILEDSQETVSSFQEYVKKKARVLLYPYFTLSGTYICAYTIYSLLIERSISIRFVVKNIYLTLSGTGIGTLWFLPVLFLAHVYLRFLKKTLVNSWRAVSVVVMIVSLIVSQQLYTNGIVGNVQYTLIGLLFNEIQIILKAFIAGGYVATGNTMWHIITGLKNQRTSKTYYFLGILLALLSYKYYEGNDMHYLKISNAPAFVICTFSSVIAVLCISCALANVPYLKHTLSFFGKNSLIVMTTHLEYRVVHLVILICSGFRDNNAFTRFIIFLGCI